MFYRFAKILLWCLFRLVYRVRVTGREHVPKEGAFLLCGNHIHFLDGPLLLAFTRRKMALMGKKEIFKKRFFAWVLRGAGVFPIDRQATADMAAYRFAIKSLESGLGMAIFSQGTRMKDFENAKSGVAMFALKTGAPIVPVGISGTYKVFSRLNVKIGPPISMDAYKGLKIKADLIDEVMGEVVPRVSELTK